MRIQDRELRAEVVIPSSILDPRSSILDPRLMLLVAAGRLLAGVALADAGGLASQGAQEIKFGAADAPVFDDVDVIDDRRVEREDALGAHAERGLAHRERLTDAFP